MISITPITAGCCEQLAVVDAEWPGAALAVLVSRPAFAGLQAREGETAAGFIIGWSVDQQAEIIQVSVIESRRRQGIGAMLLDAFLKQHARSGCQLEVREDNHPALHLYQRFGFVAEGRRQGYYRASGHGRDAIMMCLDTLPPES